MKLYEVKEVNSNKAKATFKTRSQALVFATIEHNKIKAATGQNVRFKIVER